MRMPELICAAAMLAAAEVRLAPAQSVAPSSPTTEPRVSMPQYWFGVAVENIPPAIAGQLKLKPDQGVMVVAVLPGSPAEKAGLKADDLLVELNGKPLTSQEDLARAANTPAMVLVEAGKSLPNVTQTSEIVYLRAGDRRSVRLTPERRPSAMAVTGANRQPFTLNVSEASGDNPPRQEVRNYTLPNGSTAFVGPGYQVDSKSQGTNMRVLRDAVGKGETVVMTQESDEAGNVRTTISDGKNSYPVEAGKLGNLPAHLRPLAEQMLNGQSGAKGEGSVSTDERLQILEKQNEDLRKQIEELKQLMMKNNAGK